MNLADLIIIILLISMASRGSKIGFTREIFATSGFILSIFLAAIIIPIIIKGIPSPSSRSFWTVILLLVFIFTFLTLGEWLGNQLKQKLVSKSLDRPDQLLGGVLRVFGGIIFIWLVTSTLMRLPYPGFTSEIQQSSIIGLINKNLPAAPKFTTTIGNIIAPNGFPLVFLGNEPLVNKHISLETTSQLNDAVNKDESSVVKIQGLGCGGIVEGSGFVASKGLVVTNAHVVAGIYSPYVLDQTGQHLGSVIYFDPNLDLAIIRTTGLRGEPLKINPNIINSETLGAVMGFPGGGDLEAKTAAITSQIIADGKNIYNQDNISRNIYVIQGDVQPGNSGGPFIDSSGQVDGLIFAKSTVYSDQGYALTMAPIQKALNSVFSSNNSVSTGRCAE